MRSNRPFTTLAVATMFVALAGTAGAQMPAGDPSTRLQEVLPADVAERVLATIAQARARELPAAALENRALKFAAKGVAAEKIEQAISQQADRMATVNGILEQARGRKPAGDEVEAGAEAMRLGVDGAEVREIARTAPSGRSLAVPLAVIGSLVGRGLPSDDALALVQERLLAQAGDAELEALPAQAVAGQARRPAQTGRELAGTKRPGTAGPPAGVPANGGGMVTVPTPPAPPAGGRP